MAVIVVKITFIQTLFKSTHVKVAWPHTDNRECGGAAMRSEPSERVTCKEGREGEGALHNSRIVKNAKQEQDRGLRGLGGGGGTIESGSSSGEKKLGGGGEAGGFEASYE